MGCHDRHPRSIVFPLAIFYARPLRLFSELPKKVIIVKPAAYLGALPDHAPQLILGLEINYRRALASDAKLFRNHVVWNT